MNSAVQARHGATGRARLTAVVLVVASLAATSWANAAPAASNIPASDSPFAAAQTTLVWVGTGRAAVQVNGAWQRAPGHDYEFSVTQRRHGEHWESIKTQHRRHPGYDGSAGPRDQAHYFRVDFPPSGAAADAGFKLLSSLGSGDVQLDREFRIGKMEFDAKDVSVFAPYNRYRITQRYEYEMGELLETVELFKKSGGAEVPFMKIEERAELFAPRRFDAAPNKR